MSSANVPGSGTSDVQGGVLGTPHTGVRFALNQV